MRAIRIDKTGIGKIIELAIPQPGPGQLLVRVAAVGVCLSDVELWEGSRPPAYIQYPVTPGHEWSGTVTEIGSGGAVFAVHDRVAVEGHNFCNTCFYCKRGETNLCNHYSELGFTLPGAYADYVTVRADLAHKFSAELPFEVAALTEPASCVANGILRANLVSRAAGFFAKYASLVATPALFLKFKYAIAAAGEVLALARVGCA